MDEVLKIAIAGPMPTALPAEVATPEVDVEGDETITH
jgi:hypothetical protein